VLQCINGKVYGYWKPRRPQQTLPELTGVACIAAFRGTSAWWREIQDNPGIRAAYAFVKANPDTIIDFMYTEHVNDVERHIGRIKHVPGFGGGKFMYWDLLESEEQSWQPLAGTISYTVKATGEPANLSDLKTLARRVGKDGRSIIVPPENSLTLKLSWFPSGYRYNQEVDKYEGMQQETREWHEVDPAGTLTYDNQPARLDAEFWDTLKKDPMKEKIPVGGLIKSVAVRITERKPKICTPMDAHIEIIMACTKSTVFNPRYICKGSHCVYYSACLWMDFQGMTKAPKLLAKMSPGWVIAPPGRVLAAFSERVRSRSRMLPFQLHRVRLHGLFEDIMAHRVTGVYTVVPRPSMHAVVIDANCQLIFDCFQDGPLVLDHENMARCIGGIRCTGFFEARRWVFK
jgi:hypothetical protein